MTSIVEIIKHYQRSIDKSLKNEARLLHCIDKLNKLPINMEHLQETKLGRTVNNLKNYDGDVGHAANSLVAKWKNAMSGDEDKQLHKDKTDNIESSRLKNYTDSQVNEISSTSNGDLPHDKESKSLPSGHAMHSIRPKFSHSEKSQNSRSQRKTSKHYDGKSSDWSSSSHSGSSKSRNKDKRENGSSESNDQNENNSKRENSRKTINKKRKHDGSNLIDIDFTMGTSFAEALGMLDIPHKSKVKNLYEDKCSTSTATPSNKHKRFSDNTPLLLTKRPKPEPPLDISGELFLSSCKPSTNNSEPMNATVMECQLRQPRKQSTQMTDEEMLSYSIMSRKTKTKVYSGCKAASTCNVPKLFDMCIQILKDNIDLLEFTGGVPFDILLPILERTTPEQLIILEDYNPYLMEDTNCLWEQHCKRRFRCKRREELETWREMFLRCLDEEQVKFESLTASILSKENPLRQTKPTYVDTNAKAPRNMKINQAKHSRITSPIIIPASCHSGGNKTSVGVKINKKQSKKYKDDPDWTPTTWYKTLYKKSRDPKPPKPPKPLIKKTIDMLRYDRAKAFEKRKQEWKKRPR